MSTKTTKTAIRALIKDIDDIGHVHTSDLTGEMADEHFLELFEKDGVLAVWLIHAGEISDEWVGTGRVKEYTHTWKLKGARAYAPDHEHPEASSDVTWDAVNDAVLAALGAVRRLSGVTPTTHVESVDRLTNSFARVGGALCHFAEYDFVTSYRSTPS